jgi:hypothetical protein
MNPKPRKVEPVTTQQGQQLFGLKVARWRHSISAHSTKERKFSTMLSNQHSVLLTITLKVLIQSPVQSTLVPPF